jgi:hypothetical protein
MSIENIGKIEDVVEEEKTFEQLEYTRDFGALPKEEVKKILKENFEYWRLPTTAEFLALYKQHKKKFFAKRSYWAGNYTDNNLAHELLEFKIGIMGPGWSFGDENYSNDRNLVLFKKDTHIDGTEEQIKEIEETYPF